MFGQKSVFHPPLTFPTSFCQNNPQSPVSNMYADEKHSYPVILWAKDYLQLSKHAQSEKAIHVTQLQFLTQTLCSINT